jgi:dTDP-4-amino-4,6-dideoxygalactose transaminase
MKNKIPFNIPFVSGLELTNFKAVIKKKKFSGRGWFTKKCENFLSQKYQRYSLLTSSCTHALEVVAFLLKLKKGDEVIVPSYTFVSTANAFAIRGAKIVFADTYSQYPCINPESIKKKISIKTKALCVVHYAGISCDMKEIATICKKNKIKLIEDCAHSFDAFGYGKRLGTFGDFSTLSFHDTKNITSGEGGALIVKKKSDYLNAKIIIEKGTNRSKFYEQKVKKYSWVSLGSSYELSEINSSFLYSQIKFSKIIKTKRLKIFKFYNKNLSKLATKNFFDLPFLPGYAKVNGHIYYIVFNNNKDLNNLKKFAKKKGIIFQDHYECLHRSPFILKNSNFLESLPNSEKFELNLLRLPIYPGLNFANMNKVVNVIKSYFKI